MTEAERPVPVAVRWAQPGDAAALAAHIAAAVRAGGPKHFAFTGGSTPGKVYPLLAAMDLDWSQVTITLTDDRRVAFDHPASNFGQLRAGLGHTAATLVPLDEGAPAAPFDLVWLGMGEDGHVASLFPHMHALLRPGPTVIATTPVPLPEGAPFDRLSLNKRALKATREIVLAVTGAKKRALIEEVLRRGSDAYPVSDFLRGYGPPVTIYWSE